MTLYITGGWGCLVKHFHRFNAERLRFVDDICAAAKGYEYMAELQIKGRTIAPALSVIELLRKHRRQSMKKP